MTWNTPFESEYVNFPSTGMDSLEQHASATGSSQPSLHLGSHLQANETKPQLGNNEVEILEREFEKNHKLSTQTKRQFAEDMSVELSAVNVSTIEPTLLSTNST